MTTDLTLRAGVTHAMGIEAQYFLAIGYKAGRDTRIARGLDGHRDFFTPDELEKAAWAFLAKGSPTVGLFHADGTEGAARVVESYIYRGEPWEIGGTVVTAGDWLIGAICDEPAWDLVKSGQVTGISMQGRAKRRTPRSDS